MLVAPCSLEELPVRGDLHGALGEQFDRPARLVDLAVGTEAVALFTEHPAKP